MRMKQRNLSSPCSFLPYWDYVLNLSHHLSIVNGPSIILSHSNDMGNIMFENSPIHSYLHLQLLEQSDLPAKNQPLLDFEANALMIVSFLANAN